MTQERTPIPRRRLRLWWTAVVLTVLPLVFGLVVTLLGAPTSFAFATVTTKVCQGWSADLRLASRPAWAVLKGMPLIVVGPAFAGWALCRRRGLPRTATGIGWTAPAFLTAIALAEPALVAFDGAQGEDCLRAWGPMLGWSLGSMYYLLPAGAAVAALRGPQRRRRGRTALGIVVMPALLLGAVTTDRGTERPISEPDACESAPRPSPAATETPAEAIARLPRMRRELAFLCSARGRSPFSPGAPEPADQAGRSDQELLATGHRVCGALGRTTPGDRTTGSLLAVVAGEWSGGEAIRTAAYLCPDAAARWSPDLRSSARQKAEARVRYEARMNAACVRPRLAGTPSRRATAAVFVGEGGGYFVSDGPPSAGDPFNAAIDDGLISARGNTAAVMTGIEDGHLCLTVAAYRDRPPLMLDGWDRVVEVGVDTPEGRLRVSTLAAGTPELPVLSLKGTASYRLRVYVRDREKARASTADLPVEEHLVVVFPGRSKRRIVYRNTER